MKKIKLLVLVMSVILFTSGAIMAETKASSLSLKQQAIAQAASYSARGDMEGLKQALISGLDAGVSINEFKEILVQVYAYCGFPRSLNALSILMQVTEERGNKDDQGKLPSKVKGNSLKFGTKNQTELCGGPVKGKLFDFAPAIEEYLKAHLFGDIFSRDNIDWQTRELATIAMLASRKGVEGQLNSHINVGKHNGLTDEQIDEILCIASKTGAENVLFGFGKENTAYAKYFIGKSYLQPLNAEQVQIANVTFEPRCRNNWHIHHKSGQILMCVQGRGWYQEWGKPAQELHPGDVVNIPPEVKHWHGAAKNSWFTHIAMSVPVKNSSTEWLEQVSDEEYNKLQ